MDSNRPPTIDYASPVVGNPLRIVGARRLAIAVGGSLAHFFLGFAALAFFNNAYPFVNTVLMIWLVPFGWLAISINQHKLLDAACGNSLFCGFAVTYFVTAVLNRRRRPNSDAASIANRKSQN